MAMIDMKSEITYQNLAPSSESVNHSWNCVLELSQEFKLEPGTHEKARTASDFTG